MRALLAPTFNYREPLTTFQRGRHRRDRLSCQCRVDKITNGPYARGYYHGRFKTYTG
jgi:hypothetical protein